jgi:hypothetical protein
MNSRRKFIADVSKGAVLTSVALSPSVGFASKLVPPKDFINKDKKLIRIGIIGAENSHTATLGKLFNVQKAFPDVELQYVWGETDEFAKKAAADGKIPNIVKNPNDMLGKIDALIVDHRHAKFHLEPAIPYIKAGIPTFIDKPFCYRVEEGKKFLKMARDLGTPVSSFSTAALSAGTFDIKKQVEEAGQINHMVCFGPVDIYSQWGGVFFYGVHLVDTLSAIFGDFNIEKVRVTRNGKNAVADLAFKSGMLATLIFMVPAYEFRYLSETKKNILEIKSKIEREPKPELPYVKMVEMFRTGVEPRSHESILYSMAVLEALEKSVEKGKWKEINV